MFFSREVIVYFQVVELRQELRSREGGPEGGEPKKVRLQIVYQFELLFCFTRS